MVHSKTVMIPARWEWSEGDLATALVAGSEWLGYVMHPDEEGVAHHACIGAGMDAPIIAAGTLEDCKAAIIAALVPPHQP